MNEFNTIGEEKSKADNALRKMKEYEKTIKMHYLRINEKTVVYCKNEDRLEDYKKLK